jgi:hypothetical protein
MTNPTYNQYVWLLKHQDSQKHMVPKIYVQFYSGMSKRTSYGKIYCPDVCRRRPEVRAHPRLPRGRNFACGRFLLSTLVKIRPRRRNPASAWTRRVHADGLIPSLPSPSLPSPLPCGPSLLSTRTRTLKINK